jgi:hypothetical protein
MKLKKYIDLLPRKGNAFVTAIHPINWKGVPLQLNNIITQAEDLEIGS